MSEQSDGAGKAGRLPNRLDLTLVYRTFVLLAVAGLVAALLYSIAVSLNRSAALAVFGGSLLVAGAFTLIGSLIGFLFAIPRSRQEQGPVQPAATPDSDRPRQRLSDYAANTNLEQISDWLTKILVGISLIRFNQISEQFGSAGTALAPLLGTGATARPAVLSLMTYFMLWGFFFAYLLTRLWLPKALSRAEREEEVQKREVENEAALLALERRTYDLLYQPDGYKQAINEIERQYAKSGSKLSPWLWLYLACAYGQRHAAEKKAKNEQAAADTREKVIAAVQEALKDRSTLPLLERLYRSTDPDDDDFATLKGDPILDELLGK